tara:strand:+ start:141 stop:599 length:459 start_codon:yes stop_codon:yes gene_type:complete
MLTLFTTALGFATSFAPNILNYFQDKKDKEHELNLLKAETEMQLKLGEQRLETMVVEGDIREIEAAHKEQAAAVRKASTAFANLSASVRPVVTYLFVAEFLLINWAIIWVVLSTTGITLEGLQSLLDDRFFALLSSMIAFWFGNRAFGKRSS